ncbi:MAG: hypothetical protein WAU01_05005, partial [Saprospiraceae bacterium]
KWSQPDTQQAGIFTLKVYRDIILDNFGYCRKHKGLQIFAYFHGNPVRSDWVEKAEDWMYSSQRNCSGLESQIPIPDTYRD